MLASASEYYSLQQRITLAALVRAAEARSGGTREVAKIVAAFQALAIREASLALANMLSEQAIATAPAATPVTSGLVGVTSAGFPLEAAIQGATTLTSFNMIVATQLQDVARNAMGLGIVTRPRMGYVRQISANACARCAILGGRFYPYSAGFLRHPRCACKNIPTREDLAPGLTITPDEYFRSLTKERQDEVFTAAGAQAIRDGADMSQVVNVYRRTAGMQFAQVSPIKTDRFGNKFTTEGTTKRGAAGKAQLRLRQNSPQQMRLMPESIYHAAKDREDAIRLLRLYGYVL